MGNYDAWRDIIRKQYFKYGNSVSGLPGIFALKEDYDMKDTPIEKSDDGLFHEYKYTSAELDLMSKKADKGDIEAQYLLGLALCSNLDQTINSPKGNCNNEYIAKSAEGGYAPAQYLLGIALCPDLDQTITSPEGICNNEYIAKSAEGGYAPAQCLMGMVHIDSEMESELTESEMWFKKASDQGIFYATLSLYKVQCVKLNIEWDDKYAETDSSIANYEEANKFSLKVKDLFEAVESNYEENKRIDDNTTNNDETFAHMSEILMDFLGDLYPRTLVYLENIENDNKIREQINTAISMALLIADEDVFDTTKRVLNIVESMNESVIDRETRIRLKH